MRRLLPSILVLLLAIPMVAAGMAAWVLYTGDGLAWAARQASRVSGGALTLEYEGGTLDSGADFAAIRYGTPTLAIDAQKVRLRISPAALLRLTLRVEELRAETLHVRTEAQPDERREPIDVPALPFALQVQDAHLARVIVEREGTTTALDEVFLRYEGGPDGHRVHEARLHAFGFGVSAAGTVASEAPYAIEAHATLRRETPAPSVSARLRAEGDLQRMALEIEAAAAGASARAQAGIEPAAGQPLSRLTATLAGFDLRAFDSALPQTALAGKLTLTRTNERLAGQVDLSNAMSGPYDAGHLPVKALRADVRTDLRGVELTNLAIDLGAGRLAGSAQATSERIALQLTAREVDLAALHGRLRQTNLSGKVESTISREHQSATADLTQDDMRLAFRAERDDTAVTLHEATLHARGSEARARGSLSLAGEQPFSAKITFGAFDPAAWGDFPRGTINGTAQARGTLAGREAKLEFALSESLLSEAALAGKGRISVQGERLVGADVSLRLGDNHLTLTGTFGAPGDTLRAQWNVRRLEMLHPQLSGTLRGEAQITGTLPAPRVDFKARGESLHAPGASVERAAASGTLAREPAAPLRLEVQASGVEAADRPFERVRLEVTGTRAAHVAALNAKSGGLDVQARARGGWHEENGAWSGSLLEFTNRGPLDAALEAPVDVSVSAARVVVGAFTLRVLDGRLHAEEARYEEGRWSTKGRFSRLPVLDLAKAAGVPPRVAGGLRVSGDWMLVEDGAVRGAFTAKRESGDIALGPEGNFPMELRALSLAARIDAAQLQFDASVASRLVNAEANGTVGVSAADGTPVSAASPLRFDATVSVAQLAPVASLLQLTAIVNGALEAKLAGSGTLGKPVVSGEVRGERLAVALPQQGIDLRDGALRAVLLERAIRFESFSLRGGGGSFTARGDMAYNGADTRLEWQAERLLLLARPDRRLIVSGKGHAGVAAGNISLSGGVQAEEAYFEIAPQGLPEPGSDVIVVGRQRQPERESTLARMLLEIVFNFGENFRVRGRGVDALLKGEITVATTQKGELRAKGTVRTARGVYTALGQRLEIDRGELIFTGPIDNPGLDIRAMRKRQAVEAGVAVTGTLKNPVARIVSEPAVPEHEAISWLLLGHGPGEATRGDLAMLPLAAGSLLGKGDSPTLAQRFGLDTLGLRGAGTEKQFVTIGKRIADNLYVGFEQGLGTAASILKLEYDLTEHVLLRAQTGESNAVGVFYRYSFD